MGSKLSKALGSSTYFKVVMAEAHIPATISSKRILPVMFIIGATGTGKSDLAIEMAKRFHGEIINADAMQLYKGLDIVTNKVSDVERRQIPHHLIDVLDPFNLSYTIHDFKRSATSIIDNLLAAGKLPIIVGGTNYYIDSLIWNSLISNGIENVDRFSTSHSRTVLNRTTRSFLLNKARIGAHHGESGSELDSDEPYMSTLPSTAEEMTAVIRELDTEYLRQHIDELDGERLHSALMIIDPLTARSFHPNQLRKTIRALEVFRHHGRTMSSFVQEINSCSGNATFGAQLQRENIVVIWLQCEQQILDKRLDARVDQMLDHGLIQELDAFHQLYNEQIIASEGKADYTKGVFQSIGLKEFHDYLMLSSAERLDPAGQKLLKEGIERLKIATRRYARYQDRWVRKQFFEERNSAFVPPVYTLNASDKEKFEDDVVKPAAQLIDALMQGTTPLLSKCAMSAKDKVENEPVYMKCEVCSTLCIRRSEWEAHLKSSRHKRRAAGLLKRSKLQKQMASPSSTNPEACSSEHQVDDSPLNIVHKALCELRDQREQMLNNDRTSVLGSRRADVNETKGS